MAIILALGCPPVPAAGRIEVADDSGTVIRLDRPAQKVVPLYGAFGDLLIAMDAQNLVGARTAADRDNPALASLPAIGTHMRPNLEMIAALKPDLVLQMKGRGEASREVAALRDLGLKVAEFEINSFAQLFDCAKKIGELTGRREQADQLVSSWRKRLAALEKASAGQTKPRVFYEARYPNLLAAGQKGIVNDIIKAAGGENVVKVPKKFARLNEEELIALDPEYYVAQKGPMNPEPGAVEAREHFNSLDAVTHGRVLIVDEKKFARPGPASVDAAELLFRWLSGESGTGGKP